MTPVPMTTSTSRALRIGPDGKSAHRIALELSKDVDRASDADVHQAVCGAGTTLLVLRDGRVFTCDDVGRGPEPNAGYNNQNNNHLRNKYAVGVAKLPRQMKGLVDIRKLAVGSFGSDPKLAHCAAVSYAGQLFMWGCGNQGQLGIGKIIGHTSTPRLVDDFPQNDEEKSTSERSDDFVHDVACGDGFTVALVTDGETASDPSLSSHARQTLHENRGNMHEPMAAPMPLGELYAWGNNDHGQLGCGRTENNVSSPGKVQIPAHMGIGRLACGQSHVVALAYHKSEGSYVDSSNVFTWGAHSNGRLGVADTIGDIFVPREADTRNLNICDVAAGDSHSVALTMKGRVVAWGDNSQGQLGVGRKTEWTARPTTVRITDHETVAVVQARGDANVALTDCGNVLQWGTLHTTSPQAYNPSSSTSHVEETSVMARLRKAGAMGTSTTQLHTSTTHWTAQRLGTHLLPEGSETRSVALGPAYLCIVAANADGEGAGALGVGGSIGNMHSSTSSNIHASRRASLGSLPRNNIHVRRMSLRRSSTTRTLGDSQDYKSKKQHAKIIEEDNGKLMRSQTESHFSLNHIGKATVPFSDLINEEDEEEADSDYHGLNRSNSVLQEHIHLESHKLTTAALQQQRVKTELQSKFDMMHKSEQMQKIRAERTERHRRKSLARAEAEKAVLTNNAAQKIQRFTRVVVPQKIRRDVLSSIRSGNTSYMSLKSGLVNERKCGNVSGDSGATEASESNGSIVETDDEQDEEHKQSKLEEEAQLLKDAEIAAHTAQIEAEELAARQAAHKARMLAINTRPLLKSKSAMALSPTRAARHNLAHDKEVLRSALRKNGWQQVSSVHEWMEQKRTQQHEEEMRARAAEEMQANKLAEQLRHVDQERRDALMRANSRRQRLGSSSSVSSISENGRDETVHMVHGSDVLVKGQRSRPHAQEEGMSTDSFTHRPWK